MPALRARLESAEGATAGMVELAKQAGECSYIATSLKTVWAAVTSDGVVLALVLGVHVCSMRSSDGRGFREGAAQRHPQA